MSRIEAPDVRVHKKKCTKKNIYKKTGHWILKVVLVLFWETFLFTTNIFALKYWVVWGKKENKILNYKEGEKINPPLPHFF